MDRLGHKLVALAVIFASIFLAATIPILISTWFEKQGKRGLAILSGIMCFGGGVFLGSYLLHMTPEVQELIQKTINTPQHIHYPVAFVIIGAGFFLMMFIERVTMELQKLKERQSTGPSAGAVDCEQQQVAVVSLQTLSVQGPGTGGQQNMAFSKDEVVVMDDKAGSSKVVQVVTQDVEEHTGGHSHLPGASGRSIVLLVALSVDCIFEGLSLGLQPTISGVWNMVLAILSHEIASAFSLGLKLKQLNTSKRTLLMGLIYALTCPVGIAIGTSIIESGNKATSFDLVHGVLLGLTAGVFLYVTFFEILHHEISHNAHVLNLLAVLLGFGVMGCLMIVHNLGHDHDDDDDHDHDHDHDHCHNHTDHHAAFASDGFIML